MTIVPRVVAAFAGFERIQAYLLRPSLNDQRGTLPRSTTQSVSWDPTDGQLAKPSPAMQIKNLSLGSKLPILRNVNIEVTPGSVTFISGPVGSGKSALLHAIIGEMTPTHGSISLSTKRIGFCAQRPWLPSGNIKEAILGVSDVGDSQWYQQVVKACCLAQDFESLPTGDITEIGSRGLNLSGGQRQRVVGNLLLPFLIFF